MGKKKTKTRQDLLNELYAQIQGELGLALHPEYVAHYEKAEEEELRGTLCEIMNEGAGVSDGCEECGVESVDG